MFDISSVQFKEFSIQQIKNYTQTRFKDITSIIKSRPLLTCVSFLTLAVSLYSIKVFSEEIRDETCKIKFHYKKKFIYVTSAIKLYPVISSSLFFIFSFCIYSFKYFRYFILFGLVFDYLNNTYFFRKPFSSDGHLGRMLVARTLTFQKLLEAYQHLNGLLQESRSISLSSEDPEDLDVLNDFLSGMSRQVESLKQKVEAHKNDFRPVFLILQAKYDHNQALILFNKDRNILINDSNEQGVKALEEKYKVVVVENIANIDEMKGELEKVTNVIQHIWILAHGSPTSMNLDDHHQIKNSDVEDLLNLMEQKLSKDAHIVLFSCSTGQPTFFGDNIATKFSQILPGRTIWAPKIPTGVMTVNLKEDLSSVVHFWGRKSRLQFLIEKAWNICRLRPFEKIQLEFDVTAQIKNGKSIS